MKWRKTELFDIDKELRALSTGSERPSEELRQETRRMVREAICAKQRQVPTKRRRLAYYPAAAAILAVIMIVSVFSAAPAQAAGYYTIDINPSVSIAVDESGNVLSAEAKNDDAKDLLQGLEFRGLRFEDALKVIIKTAQQKRYLKNGGHLLVAHFGSDKGISQKRLEEIVNEQLPESGVNGLAINGSMGDYERYDKEGKKAGIELLMDSAHKAGIEDGDIDDVIENMSDKQEDSGGKDNGQNSGSNANNGRDNNGQADKEDKPRATDEKDNDDNNSQSDKVKDQEDKAKDKDTGSNDGKDKDVKDTNEKGGKKDKKDKESKGI